LVGVLEHDFGGGLNQREQVRVESWGKSSRRSAAMVIGVRHDGGAWFGCVLRWGCAAVQLAGLALASALNVYWTL
jgi:hypothetical protein